MGEDLEPSESEAGEEQELINLPDEAEMMKRLKAVNDSPHLVENFYPLLLREAGQEKYPEGIKLMVALAIYDYVKDLPPVMTKLMNMQLEDFVEALSRKS